MKSRILVGAQEFMQALSESVMVAKHSLYVQAMTFEGDTAGEQLIDLMLACSAKDKRLLIDSFSKVVVSDHFVFGPRYFLDEYFRKEIKQTKALIDKAQQAGIQVRFTNPVGPLLYRYPLRNHKKMMIIDGEVSYLGGINFSDHNFAWHDMMIELGDSSIASCLENDFMLTWEGVNQSHQYKFRESELYFFNGAKSKELYQKLWEKLLKAKKSIEIISPYVSDPLLSQLKASANRGVAVSIIAPGDNNKNLFKNLLLTESTKGYFQLFHYQGMSHLKAMLIDGKELVFGSSNYDLVSYYFEQEVVMVTQEESLVMKFRENVLNAMMSQSSFHRASTGRVGLTGFIISALKLFCKVASNSLLKPH